MLGRNQAGTLRLSEDDTGLAYEIDLPDTQAARDVYALIERGDVSQSSFAFKVVKEQRSGPRGGPVAAAVRESGKPACTTCPR